jgi:CheY-like chemotaxis protein
MTQHLQRWRLWQNIGLVSDVQLNRADAAARAKGCSLDEALVKLDIARYPQLRQALSKAFSLPNLPLLEEPPPEDALRQLPGDCAAHWGTSPVSYDDTHSILTLAVSDPSQAQKLESVFGLLMQPKKLAFTVASAGEIREAIKKNYGYDTTVIDAPPKRSFTITDSPNSRCGTMTPPPAAGQSASPRVGNDAQGRFGNRIATAKISEDMNQYLTGTASLLVAAYLREDSQAMNTVRSRVRYIRLLGTRLGFSRDELNTVVLAAWLSGIDDRRRVIKQFACPYDLEPIIYPETTGDLHRHGALALSLVRCYEKVLRENGSAVRDVGLTRRQLQLSWPPSREQRAVLEVFLQVLMDEQFLDRCDRLSGRILVVDPSLESTAVLSPALFNRGYTVQVVCSAAAAFSALALQSPSAVIVGADLPDRSGIEFCRMIRATEQTCHIPLLMLLPPDHVKQAAEALRAGADDFLADPKDAELLLLKLEKLSASHATKDNTGVSGSLADMAFSDMIQILCAGNKDMEISLQRRDETGHVFVKQGTVVHAVCGDLEGERSFFSFMRWEEGVFTAKQCTEFPEETITSSTMSLLMEGARLVDEEAPADLSQVA